MADPRYTIVRGLNDSPGGRPTAIFDMIADGDGTEPRSVIDVIVEDIAAGGYLDTASANAGVNYETAKSWLRTGARVEVLLEAVPTHQCSDYEQACLEFRRRYNAGKRVAVRGFLSDVDEVARGGRKIVKTKVKRLHGPIRDDLGRVVGNHPEAGTIVESITETSVLPPDGRLTVWRLAQLDKRFSPRLTFIAQGEGDPDADELREDVADAFAAYLEAEAEAAASEGQRALPAPAEDADA